MEKVPKEKRTFETRLKFLDSIFSQKYSAEEIIKNSIEHRLGRTFETYLEEVNQSMTILLDKKPETVIKKLSKEDK